MGRKRFSRPAPGGGICCNCAKAAARGGCLRGWAAAPVAGGGAWGAEWRRLGRAGGQPISAAAASISSASRAQTCGGWAPETA